MFNPYFTAADAAPILDQQSNLARQSLDKAISQHPPNHRLIGEWLDTQRNILHANPQHIHDPLFLGTLEDHASALSRSGQHEAAMAWGCAAYIAGRRFAHGWFGLLDIAIAASALATMPAAAPRIDSISDVGKSIPRRLMQFWDKPTPPDDVALLMDRMKHANATWFYHRIEERQATDYIDSYFGARARQAFDTLSHVAARSDLFRACWLYERGGVYVDADEDCVGRIEQLVPPDCHFVLTWSKGRPSCINNWFVATTPSNPLMRNVIQLAILQIEEAARHGIKLNAWILTGPGVYTMTCLDALALSRAGAGIDQLRLIEEPEYRRVVNSAEFLSYRSDPRSNWRLEKLS